MGSSQGKSLNDTATNPPSGSACPLKSDERSAADVKNSTSCPMKIKSNNAPTDGDIPYKNPLMYNVSANVS